MMDQSDSSPVAYSYIRFSTPEQSKGDSLRRQTEAARRWCEANGVVLDESTTLHDLGKSAYLGEHRKNPDRYALAGFLKLVEAGRVPRDSHLIIENLDRLTREHLRAAVTLFLSLLEHGVNIVTTSPERVFRHDSDDMTDVIIAVVELSRGHSESKVKSERVAQSWEERRRQTRAGNGILTKRLPAWIEEHNGELQLIPERAAVVKRIFQLAAAGYGMSGIVRRLNDEKIPAFVVNTAEGKAPARAAFCGSWRRGYIGLILKDRRALGEFQPRRTDGTPDGEPIKGYYPAVISEDEWLAARAGTTQRKTKPGRIGEHVNLFQGLIRHARGEGNYFSVQRDLKTKGGGSYRVLINSDHTDRREKCYSFPESTFERAVLTLLKELDPREVLNGGDEPDDTIGLASELARVEAKISELEAELLEGDVSAIAKVLRQQEAKKKKLAEQLQEARQKARYPLSERWGECKTLIDLLDSATDVKDCRIRLRAALRSIIEEISLLVVPRGQARFAAVQIWFAGGKRKRDYLILHRSAKGSPHYRTPASWEAWSLADVAGDGLDIRKPSHAARLEKVLMKLDLSMPT